MKEISRRLYGVNIRAMATCEVLYQRSDVRHPYLCGTYSQMKPQSFGMEDVRHPYLSGTYSWYAFMSRRQTTTLKGTYSFFGVRIGRLRLSEKKRKFGFSEFPQDRI